MERAREGEGREREKGGGKTSTSAPGTIESLIRCLLSKSRYKSQGQVTRILGTPLVRITKRLSNPGESFAKPKPMWHILLVPTKVYGLCNTRIFKQCNLLSTFSGGLQRAHAGRSCRASMGRDCCVNDEAQLRDRTSNVCTDIAFSNRKRSGHGVYLAMSKTAGVTFYASCASMVYTGCMKPVDSIVPWCNIHGAPQPSHQATHCRRMENVRYCSLSPAKDHPSSTAVKAK
jgi:hypothetical protein